MKRPRAILAFESSCDETAIAAVSEQGEVFFEKIFSQISIHNQFGGVVPEVASREHFNQIDFLFKNFLDFLKVHPLEIVGVAATQGPGLLGSLLVASSFAKGVAAGLQLPFIGVHHLRGHIASALLEKYDHEKKIALTEWAGKIFPSLVLLVSGGHTQILKCDSSLKAQSLLESVDDSAGECFDKSAKLMGLPYPGGPMIEKLALALENSQITSAKSHFQSLPSPKTSEGDFSFSGLKTSVRNKIEKNILLKQEPAFCWALQERIGEILCSGLERSLKKLDLETMPKSLIFCGGVSANQSIRYKVQTFCEQKNLSLHLAPLKYCTDNAAMIGAAAWIQDEAYNVKGVFARRALDAV